MTLLGHPCLRGGFGRGPSAQPKKKSSTADKIDKNEWGKARAGSLTKSDSKKDEKKRGGSVDRKRSGSTSRTGSRAGSLARTATTQATAKTNGKSNSVSRGGSKVRDSVCMRARTHAHMHVYVSARAHTLVGVACTLHLNQLRTHSSSRRVSTDRAWSGSGPAGRSPSLTSDSRL